MGIGIWADTLPTQFKSAGSSLAVQADGLAIAAHYDTNGARHPVLAVVEVAAIVWVARPDAVAHVAVTK
jgi:hypothetical protein